jgi:hypothetical protein
MNADNALDSERCNRRPPPGRPQQPVLGEDLANPVRRDSGAAGYVRHRRDSAASDCYAEGQRYDPLRGAQRSARRPAGLRTVCQAGQPAREEAGPQTADVHACIRGPAGNLHTCQSSAQQQDRVGAPTQAGGSARSGGELRQLSPFVRAQVDPIPRISHGLALDQDRISRCAWKTSRYYRPAFTPSDPGDRIPPGPVNLTDCRPRTCRNETS